MYGLNSWASSVESSVSWPRCRSTHEVTSSRLSAASKTQRTSSALKSIPCVCSTWIRCSNASDGFMTRSRGRKLRNERVKLQKGFLCKPRQNPNVVGFSFLLALRLFVQYLCLMRSCRKSIYCFHGLRPQHCSALDCTTHGISVCTLGGIHWSILRDAFAYYQSCLGCYWFHKLHIHFLHLSGMFDQLASITVQYRKRRGSYITGYELPLPRHAVSCFG